MPEPRFNLTIRLPKGTHRLDGREAREILAWSVNELAEALEAWPLDAAPLVVLEPAPD